MKTKKHLVYAEDLIYEIMQHPSRNISKGLIRQCAAEVIKENKVTIWKHIWNCIAGKVYKYNANV